jgi:glutathione S-transferase
MGLDKKDYPALKAWSDKFACIPGVAKSYAERESRQEVNIRE